MVNFLGFFLPKENDSNDDRANDSDGESESDNDDFENPDYRDIVQIANGRYQSYTPSKARYHAERLQELEMRNGRFVLKGEKVVRARFDNMFTQPWWMVEVMEINTGSRTRRAEKIPSYSIRCDDNVDKSLLSLFLTQGCCVNEQHAALFLEFIEGSGNLRPTFVDLLRNLREFAGSSEINSEIAKQIRTSFASKPAGKAFLVPELTKVAHRLFPRHVSTLFSSTSLEVLRDIEQALQSEPWILGYQTVLQERFGIWRCEVKLSAFINCDLLEAMSVVHRDALYIYNALCKSIFKYGHTFLPMWKLKHKNLYNAPYTPGAYCVTNWEESLTYLREINAVKTTANAFGRGCDVFLPHIRGYEVTIVRSICKMMKNRPWVESMEIDEKVFGGDDDQLKAARLMTRSPVVVLSGRGGCGKTHVVSSVLSGALKVKRSQMKEEKLTTQDECTPTQDSSSDAQNPPHVLPLTPPSSYSAAETPQKKVEILQNSGTPQDEMVKTDPCGHAVLLTAPTGRAASILGKRTGLPSYTLHSVIFSYFRWLKEVKNGEKHSAWKFSDVKLLVCDESSLISVKPFSTLISILMKKASLQQIILLGDKNQLPSIEPGNLLSDVYHALEPYGSSITLRTNHRAESQLIVENAGKISCQEMPHFPPDPKRGFISIPFQSRQDDCDDMAVTQVVRDLLNNKNGTVTLPEPQKSQFIAFRRRDCMNINEICAQHYNKHSIKTSKGKLDFQTGDKVCVRKNVACFDAYTKDEVKLCNGDIFFIKEVVDEEDNHNKKTTYLALDDGERIVKVDMKTLKKAKLCHAWARTIHTYQGSEIDTVVYVVGSPIYQDWRHVYTAVTRGVRQVIVVHDPNHLRQVVGNPPFERNTKLKKFLTDDLAKPSVSDEEESDPETDVLAPSASDVTTCPGYDEDDDDVLLSQCLDIEYSALGHPAANESLAMAHSSSSNHESWEDELKDESDDEALAWALHCSQQLNAEDNASYQELGSAGFTDNNKPNGNAMKESSEYLLECTGPHSNASYNDSLAMAHPSSSYHESWKDELKGESDDEALAWALHCSQQLNTEDNASYQELGSAGFTDNNKPNGNAMKESSEYLLECTGPHSNASYNGHFQIARTNLDIKKKNSYSMECGLKVNSHSSVARDGSQSERVSGNVLASSHGVRVKSEQQDVAEGGMTECSSTPFSDSLSGLTHSGRNAFYSTVYRGSPATSSTSVPDKSTPKACSRRFSESSGLVTPPQTPPNVKSSTTSLIKQRSNTFPRKSVSQRTQFNKFGGTSSKRRRRSITAKYGTWCRLCKNSISVGEEITHLDSESTWVHLKCVQCK